MKVQTKKLNNQKKKPIPAPAFVPSKIAVTITGTWDRVATTGPIAGSEPRGVKHTIASIAVKIENCERRSVLFYCQVKPT
ncbi:hypothetical protein HNQ56_004806 [Anaerotaenia torta]